MHSVDIIKYIMIARLAVHADHDLIQSAYTYVIKNFTQHIPCDSLSSLAN